MAPMWFFMDGEVRRGPLSTEDLIAALISTPEPRLTKVWREGLPDWERAGAFQELSGKLPPRIQADSRRPEVSPSVRPDRERDVAQRYRRLVLLVGVQLLTQVPRLFVDEPSSDPQIVVALVGVGLGFIAGIVAAVTAYQLMKGLNSKVPALWAVGMFVPLINVLVLLSISSKAQAWCKERGIPVGFFGPKLG